VTANAPAAAPAGEVRVAHDSVAQ